MKRKKSILIGVAVIVVAGFGVWLAVGRHKSSAHSLRIYGNIDIRQVELAFDDAGRIQTLAVEEGGQVRPGLLLAELNPVRFQDAVQKARAQVAQQQQILARLLAGSRPEEIIAARARVAGAATDWRNAQLTYRRLAILLVSHFVSHQAVDNARRTMQAAHATLRADQQALILAVKGPRKEDIAAARAALGVARGALALALRELADTKLYATAAGVVEDRILEPGDMATPQTPVFTIALNNPVWARAYVPETELARIEPGMRAYLENQDFPNQRFPGWIGYISPTAEFTPKAVETTELRSQLVYQVRAYACNPTGALRLGMPVTVVIPLPQSPARTSLAGHPCEP
ncbi:MAG: efflux RND transporter periplasmic adaptor subunit [Acidiferrobacter sp.]